MTKFPCYKEATTAEEVTFFKGQYGFEVMEYHVRRQTPSLLHKNIAAVVAFTKSLYYIFRHYKGRPMTANVVAPLLARCSDAMASRCGWVQEGGQAFAYHLMRRDSPSARAVAPVGNHRNSSLINLI